MMNLLHLNEASSATPERRQAFSNRIYRIQYILQDMEMHGGAYKSADPARVSSTGNLGATIVAGKTEVPQNTPVTYEPNPLFSNPTVSNIPPEATPVVPEPDNTVPQLDPAAALADVLASYDSPDDSNIPGVN